MTPEPPGPPGSLIGNLLVALRDPLAFLKNLQATYGDVVSVRKGRTYLISHPDGIKHVLQDNHQNYRKGPRYVAALKPLMGLGLLTSDGEAWKRQRHMAQPAFLKKHHDHFVQVILHHLKAVRKNWLEAAEKRQPLDLHNQIARTSLSTMLHLIFGEDASASDADLARTFLAAEREIDIVKVFNPVPLPEWFPTPSQIRFKRALRRLDAFVLDRIRARRANPGNENDLLAMYLAARDESTGAGLDDRLLRDEMITLLSAGHETLADSIAWTFYLLLTHPAEYQRVQSEIDRVLNGRLPALEDLPSFEHTTRAIQEGLRLYPPGWGFLRTALADDTIGGYPIPAGARVLISPYLTQRLATLWDNPDHFDPDRFLPERAANRHRFAWFPFSAGPRMCLGAGFAMLEAQLILAVLLQAVQIELQPNQDIRPLPRVSLKPSGPIWVNLTARSAEPAHRDPVSS
jgi:cytochrome P450